jgi:hypothetical protein
MFTQTEVLFPRKPFDGNPYRGVVAEGSTLQEIVDSVPNLPQRFATQGVVCINGEVVDRSLWGAIRPKLSRPGREIVVTMHLAPAGGMSKSKGGGGGGKGILTVIAAIAIIAVATFISAGGLTVLAPGIFGASFGAGTLGASLAAAAVSTVGLLALNALTPTPSVETESFSDRTRQDKASFADGNIISPGGIIPRVIGFHKIYPPLVSSPLIDVVDDNEIIEVMYALSGPHSWSDIRIDNFDIDEIDDVEYSTREGWTDDPDIVLFSRYGVVETPQLELSTHILDEEVKRKFKHPNTPNQDLPIWHGFIVPAEADEIWIQLIAPQGYYHQTDDAADIAVPFRLRIRPEGSVTWINLPEVHLVNKISSVFRRMIKLKWTDTLPTPNPPTTYGWRDAFYSVPPQTTNNPAGEVNFGGWEADAHFDSGGAINAPDNVRLFVDEVNMYLYGSTFESDRRWELQIMRGVAFKRGSFTASTYTYAGLGTNVHEMFLYKLSDGTVSGTANGEAIVPQNQEQLIASTMALRISAVYNETPVRRKTTEQASGLALLAIRGRNKSLNKVSAIAAGYVPDWTGTEWSNYTTTTNPAPHFRDVLVGELNYDPVHPSMMDDDNLAYWRQICDDLDLTVNLVAEGRSIAELLNTLCACGRAKPRFSDLLGVMLDTPRQQESPVQIFSPRNSNGFRFDLPLAKKPDAYIVSYKDVDQGYEDNQIIVYDPRSSEETAGSFESLTIEGIIERDKVEQRMLFDIGQLDWRPATYALDTDIESLVCRRGDLIGLSHDVIQPRAGFARVKDVLVSGPNVTGIEVDSELQLSTGTDFFALTDVFAEPDIFLVGTEFGAAIRLADGTVITKKLSSTGLTDTLNFETPFTTPAALIEDCLVVVGETSQEYGRFIVKELIPQQDLTARLLLVAEAPELYPFTYDDISEYSAGAGIAAGFTNRWSATNLTYSVQTEGIAGSVAGKELKLTATSDAHRFASLNVPSNLYRDVVVTAGLYVVAASGVSTGQAGVVARGSGAGASEAGYVFRLLSTAGGAAGGGVQVGKLVAGTFTSLGTAAFAWAVNTRYFMKLSCIRGYIKARVWPAASSEPDTWNIEIEDTSIEDAGYVGVYSFEDTADPAFDYTSVQTTEVTKLN